MVDGFPYEVPEEYRNMPLLKGRAAVDMKVKVKDNPNLEECVFHIVLDGYNAPVTAGNFVDLVERHFYDGMEIQRGNKSNIRHPFWLLTFLLHLNNSVENILCSPVLALLKKIDTRSFIGSAQVLIEN